MTALPTSPFLTAARGERATHTPVWFMRQAGRSLPEYRALRGEGSILDAIKKPELAAEFTCSPYGDTELMLQFFTATLWFRHMLLVLASTWRQEPGQ